MTAEQLEEQVRGAFVQQQSTEEQSCAHAQEVVDDSSSAVERLAEVEGQVARVGASTDVLAATVATVRANAHAVLRGLRAAQARVGVTDEIAAAVDGARQTGDPAATTERRRVSRFPCQQDVVLRVEGRENPATALDLGLGGARVTTASTRRVGVGTRVVVHWPHRSATLDLAGAVARVRTVPGGHDLGIVFDVPATAAPAGLVAVVDGLRSRVEAVPAR